MRRPLAVVLAVAAVAVVFAASASLLAPPSGTRTPEDSGEPRIVRLDDHESGVHPYIGPDPALPGKSPINLLAGANVTAVEDALVARSGHGWSAGEEDEDATPQDVAREVGVPEAWDLAEGSIRYAYVHDGQEGQWVEPDEQIQDGAYFGQRTHIRLYGSPHPDEDWTALQAHTEYLDWFTLRHEVTGVAEAQRSVEADFMGQPGVERVWRSHLDNAGPYDHDGWATVVEFAALLPAALGAAAATRASGAGLSGRIASAAASRLHPADRDRLRRAADRLYPRHGLVALAAGGPLLLVRGAGLALEAGTGLGPYVIAGILYPIVALGTPAAAYGAATGLDRRVDAGVAAALGLGAAALVDLALVGARTLPLAVVLQRSGLVAAVGLVAAGAARRATRERRMNDLVLAGLVLWVGVALASIVG